MAVLQRFSRPPERFWGRTTRVRPLSRFYGGDMTSNTVATHTPTGRRSGKESTTPLLASIAAGAIGGGGIGALFGVAAAIESGSLIGALLIIPFSVVFCGGLGAILGLLPGLSIAYCLGRLQLEGRAPVIGAAVGAMLGVTAYYVLSLGAVADFDEKLLAYIGFLVAGGLGGGVGGWILKTD